MSPHEKASPDVNQPLGPQALTPAVIRVNEKRVATGFWPKIRRTAAKIPFAAQALSVWFCARDPLTPFRARAMMMAALAYFVIPTDVIPDFIAGLGFTDDAAVFATLLTLVGRHLTPRHKQAAKAAIDQIRRES